MKKDLRYKFKKIRKKIKNKFLKDKIIYYKIITKKEVKEASLILIYVSCNDEVNTIPLIKYFIRKGIPIAVPKVSLDKMDFYYIKSLEDLKKGYKGIYEPVPNNLVTSFNKTVSITPGICFNKKGYRVGYGKGFYDKFYQTHHVYKLGITYKECIIDEDFNDKFDVPLDDIIYC